MRFWVNLLNFCSHLLENQLNTLVPNRCAVYRHLRENGADCAINRHEGGGGGGGDFCLTNFF